MTRRISRISIFVGLLALGVLGSVAPAMATPTGDFAKFVNCPLKTAGVNQCIYATTKSGEVKIGTASPQTAVPITKELVLQGGIIAEESEPFGETFVNPIHGVPALSNAAQTVPGGILGILAPSFFPEPLKAIFNEFINHGPTGVTATTELVGAIGINKNNLLNGSGIALTLPVRIHLGNEFLGPECYIGSAKSPVTLHLTTAPPGKTGTLSFKDEENLAVVIGTSLVDSKFSVPTAEGCGKQILFGIFTGIVDGAINSKLGLPAGSGVNSATLNGNEEAANASAVIASE
jgi:hypothetical protein